MSKAAELAALIGSQTALSNRNLVINGAMQVAQRGTSVTGKTSSGYFTCDRWNANIDTMGTWSFDQSSTVPSGEGFATSLKASCTTADASPAAGDSIFIQHRIEGQNLQRLKKGTSNAEKVTLSFWVRSSKTGTHIVEIRDDINTRHIAKSYSITTADTWQYVTLTYDGDTSGTLTNSNIRALDLNFWLGGGTNFTSGTLATSWASRTVANSAVGQVNLADSTSNEWYITGVQLEVGETATPFEHLSMGDELARCQRYFFNPMAGGNGQSAQISFHSMLNMGGSVSTGNNGHIAFHVPFPVSMRAAPTLTHNIDNDKIVTAAPSGTQVAFYIQNQGYRPKAGNGNLNTLSRATGTSAGCVVGTYYISPDNLKGDQINIGASNQFHFSAEL